MLLSSQQEKRVLAGDTVELSRLDSCGIFLAPGETLSDFVARIRKMEQDFERLAAHLESVPEFSENGVSLRKDARIPASFFRSAAKRTEKKYGFSLDWVPGFFVNPSGSWLFGGCAYSDGEECTVRFIIRKSFRKKERWLFYDRDELVAHELCHVARMAFFSERYEETFAYQTSGSSFRRLLGGVFLRQSDSFCFLGSALLMLLAQIVRCFCWPTMPFWPFAMLLPLVCLWLGVRYCLLRREMRCAAKYLTSYFGENASMVLFRCSDAEIREMAGRGRVPDSLQANLRWKIYQQRFGVEKVRTE